MAANSITTGGKMAELLAFVFVIAVGVIGFFNTPPYWIPILAIISSFIYMLMRTWVFVIASQAGAGRLAAQIAVTYVTQCMTVAVLFYIGFGLSKLF